MDHRFYPLFERPELQPHFSTFYEFAFELCEKNKYVIQDPSPGLLAAGVMVAKQDEALAGLRHQLVTRSGGNDVVLLEGCGKDQGDQELKSPFVGLGYDAKSSCYLAVRVEIDIEAFTQRLLAHRWAERAGASSPLFAVYISPHGEPPRFVTATKYDPMGATWDALFREMKTRHCNQQEDTGTNMLPPRPAASGMLCMAQGMLELVDKMHSEGIVLVNPSLRSFTYGSFGSKDDIKLSCLADARLVGSTGRFRVRCRDLSRVGDVCPDVVSSCEGGKHTNLFDMGALLHQMLLGGSEYSDAAGQRFYFDMPLKMQLLESHLQGCRGVRNWHTTMLGLKPALARHVAHLVCIMTSTGPHRPAMSWCCEYLQRIQVAALVTERPVHTWSQAQDHALEYYQRQWEIFDFSFKAAPAMYGGAQVYPAHQLERNTLLQIKLSFDRIASSMEATLYEELNPYTKASTTLDPDQLRHAMWDDHDTVFLGCPSRNEPHYCGPYEVALGAEGLASCSSNLLEAVAKARNCTAAEVIMAIEVGHKPWAPGHLLEVAKELEEALAAAAAAASAAPAAAGQAAHEDVVDLTNEVEINEMDMEADLEAGKVAAVAPAVAGRAAAEEAAGGIVPLQVCNRQGGPAERPAGGRKRKAATLQGAQQAPAGARPGRQAARQPPPSLAAEGEPAAAPAAPHRRGRHPAAPAPPAAAARAPAAEAVPRQDLSANLRAVHEAALATGAPAGAEAAERGLLLHSEDSSWRMSVNRPFNGPGVHLYTTVPFGESSDNRRRSRLEHELPKGYSKRGSFESDSLRRITFLYSNRDSPFFTDVEQQAAALVLEDALLTWLRCAARQREDSSPLYISLPLACAVPKAERSGAPQLDPAHFPVIFKFELRPRSQLTWQQAAEAQELWTGTRPPIMGKLAARPVFDSSMLRQWLVQAAFAAPAPGLSWRQHNALGASGWHTAVKRVLASTEALLSLPVRCSSRYLASGGYIAADWQELPAPEP